MNSRQTFVMSESVAGRLAEPRWLPNTPPLTAWPNGEWEDVTGKRMVSKILTVAMDPGPCSLVRCTHPICIQRNRQGNGVWESAYWSAILHAVDYDLYPLSPPIHCLGEAHCGPRIRVNKTKQRMYGHPQGVNFPILSSCEWNKMWKWLCFKKWW